VDHCYKRIKTTPLAPLLAKERGTRKIFLLLVSLQRRGEQENILALSPCKGERDKKMLLLPLSLQGYGVHTSRQELKFLAES